MLLGEGKKLGQKQGYFLVHVLLAVLKATISAEQSTTSRTTLFSILSISPTSQIIQISKCYDFSLTHVEHTFSFLLCDNLTLAATCADGSSFISVLLLTWLLPWSFQEHEVTCYLSFIFHFRFTSIGHVFILLFSYMHYPYILHMFTLLHTWGLWYISYSRYSDVL